MSWLAVVSVLLCFGVLAQCDSDYDPIRTATEYTEKFKQAFRAANVSVDEYSAVAEDDFKTVGVKFDCNLEPHAPTSIHDLSPKYVDVVAAMGDSVTAGFGAAAKTIIGDIFEYRGLSWSIGGYQSLDTVLTFANLIRKYNPSVTGYSTGTHIPILTKKVKFNVAVSGARTKGMLGQAETLVKEMNAKGVTDEQWKVITIWIGGNDVCAITKTDEPKLLAETYMENIRSALDYLRDNVKRAFVNVVLLIDVADLAVVRGPMCFFVHLLACDSILKTETLEMVRETCNLYNDELEGLIDGGKSYETDDFTVMLQPFFKNTQVPRKENGDPDMSYFAPDCFHFSQKGHAAGATFLWNNMFEKVGEKTDMIEWMNEFKPDCPKDDPYFATYQNSQSSGSLLNANGNDGSEHEGTNLVAILVGTGVGAIVVAVASIVVAVGIIKLRRRRDQQKGPTEKMQLLSFKN